MPIIKKTIALNSNVITNIQLNSNFNQFGDDQGIEQLYEDSKENFINPVVDVELLKYNYDQTLPVNNNLVYIFQNPDLNSPSFLGMFTVDEITGNTKNFQNSFFIFDYYNSKDISTQKKLSTNYLTKKIYPMYYLFESIYIALYKLNNFGELPLNQTYNIFIPKNFIDSTTDNIITCYCRMMFYDAKLGKTINFYNSKYYNSSNVDSNKLFFEIEINKTLKSWKFINFENLLPNTITAIEPLKTNLYSKRINDGIENFANKIGNYPTGSTFNYDTINYL